MHSQANIFVKGYPQSTTSQQLQNIFERFGTIKQVKMIKNFSFVSYANQQSAKAAVQQLNDTNFKNQKLTVQLSGKQKPKRDQTLNKAKQGDKCNVCGKQGHWARNCPQSRSGNRGDKPARRERSRQRNYKREPQIQRKKSKKSRSKSSSSSSSSSRRSYSNQKRKRRDQRKQRRSSSSSSKSSQSSSRSSYSSHSSSRD